MNSSHVDKTHIKQLRACVLNVRMVGRSKGHCVQLQTAAHLDIGTSVSLCWTIILNISQKCFLARMLYRSPLRPGQLNSLLLLLQLTLSSLFLSKFNNSSCSIFIIKFLICVKLTIFSVVAFCSCSH